MMNKNLKKYRLLNGLSMRDLADQLAVSHQTVKKYEDGDLVPNSTRLIQLAEIFKVKISDLVYNFSAPQLQYKNFRKNRLTKTKEEGLKLLISDEIGKYLEILNMAGEKNNLDQKKWTFNIKDKEDVMKVAIEVRKLLGVSNSIALDNLTDKLEDNNFLILEINFEDKFDGFCEIVDNMAFIILSSKGFERNRFTLAHELGHLILKFPDGFSDDQKEDFCNCFASNLLLPKEAIDLEIGDNRNNVSLKEVLLIAREYKVSLQAVIMRLKELDIISDSKKQMMFIELSRLGLNKKQLKLSDEHPKRKEKIIFRLEAEGFISKEEAIKYLGITTNEYFQLDIDN